VCPNFPVPIFCYRKSHAAAQHDTTPRPIWDEPGVAELRR
jgi:hypothetical protein